MEISETFWLHGIRFKRNGDTYTATHPSGWVETMGPVAFDRYRAEWSCRSLMDKAAVAAPN